MRRLTPEEAGILSCLYGAVNIDAATWAKITMYWRKYLVCWPKANPELQYRLESRRERTSGLERLCNSSGFSWN
jgi:hypothetical protein